MFKSVKYEGFDGYPELRAKCAELQNVLDEELATSADRVSVVWSLKLPTPSAPQLGRMIDLCLEDEWAGKDVLHLFAVQLDETELVRWTVRRMHMQMLSRFSGRQVERMKREPVLEGV